MLFLQDLGCIEVSGLLNQDVFKCSKVFGGQSLKVAFDFFRGRGIEDSLLVF